MEIQITAHNPIRAESLTIISTLVNIGAKFTLADNKQYDSYIKVAQGEH